MSETRPPEFPQPTMPQSLTVRRHLHSTIFAHELCSPSRCLGRLCVLSRKRLGTSLELCVPPTAAEAARRAEHRVLTEIDRLAVIFSGYDRTSEFSRWQAAPGDLCGSRRALRVLLASDYWGNRSRGAFDPRVEVLSRLWAPCPSSAGCRRTMKRPPRRPCCRRPPGDWTPAARTAERLSDCPLSLNGIAKGYIVERACEAAFAKAAGRARTALERRRRSPCARPGRPHDRHRRPVGRLRVVGTIRLYRSERPLGRHQRQVPARVPDQRQVVLACFRPEDSAAGRTSQSP